MNLQKIGITNILLGTLLLGSGILSSSAAMATDNCTKFSLTSNVVMLSPTGPAVGFAEAVREDGTVIRISAQGEIISTKSGLIPV